MLTAIDKDGARIVGWEAAREKFYYCPDCKEQLLLRQGEIKVHHFAHLAEAACKYGSQESELHLWLKKNFYQWFTVSSLYKHVDLECRIGDFIADLLLENKRSQRIAVECQCSNIEIDYFRKKTAYYSYQGIFTLWVFAGNALLDKCLVKLVHSPGSRLRYSTDPLQRKCHRWYYGKIYYFYNDNLYAIHFHSQERWQPGSCEECLQQTNCPYPNLRQCPQFRPGYMRKAKSLREISIYPIDQARLICILRPDRLRIARFNEPTWWKV